MSVLHLPNNLRILLNIIHRRSPLLLYLLQLVLSFLCLRLPILISNLVVIWCIALSLILILFLYW